MKKFFKVVPTASKPLGAVENNAQSPTEAKPSATSIEKIQKLKGNVGAREKKKRKIGLDNDIFDADTTMEDCPVDTASPAEEIVISDDEVVISDDDTDK